MIPNSNLTPDVTPGVFRFLTFVLCIKGCGTMLIAEHSLVYNGLGRHGQVFFKSFLSTAFGMNTNLVPRNPIKPLRFDNGPNHKCDVP